MAVLQAALFTTAMIGAAIYDIRNRLVDDRVCWAIVLAGLITVSPASFLGALLAGLPFYIGAGFGKNGAGDIWLSASAGFVLGPDRVIAGLTLFVAAYAAVLLFNGILSKIRHRPVMRSCPLVPIIAAGFIPAYFFA